MKTYEKPRLMALSLSGNDQLCGTCAEKNGILLKDQLGLAEVLISMSNGRFGDLSDGISADDFVGVFGQESDCHADKRIDSYCKFSSGDNGQFVIAWS